MADAQKSILLIEISVGSLNESDGLKLHLSGTANQALGAIARARFELNRLESKVMYDLEKPVGQRGKPMEANHV